MNKNITIGENVRVERNNEKSHTMFGIGTYYALIYVNNMW